MHVSLLDGLCIVVVIIITFSTGMQWNSLLVIHNTTLSVEVIHDTQSFKDSWFFGLMLLAGLLTKSLWRI